ncbi:COP9 signalosome complex subunit 7a-like protein [Hapsidospora chrysogenum ATCC 11550]|uniref:COP9 signalosome complex subunit 7a-like protein n=1 Tax=Hapsidospora chrysogenum (strain ATCC 11550 / CBS 779.69 / DSM 880 / IAM 14645 / JCM 23072 / IMI 49137) TaxID=857340 RepID=A0A086TAS8_HAPC1|nr:COP9 signalosome complex subunit 7a-like protein [Hapsidospora chrysogenum ATCC 11550]
MEQTKALNALEPFLALSKSATSPRAAVDLIRQATSAPNTFIFAELLQTPPIAALASASDPDHRAHHTLLRIFSHGTYRDYIDSTNNPPGGRLPSLTEAQTLKLRQLSLLSLARDRDNLTYAALQTHLALDSPRQVEDLVITAVYAGLLSATLDPVRQAVHVTGISPLRDLAPGAVPDMVAVLRRWSDRCVSTLGDIDAQVQAIRAAAAARETERRQTEDKLGARVAKASDPTLLGMAGQREFPGGRWSEPKQSEGSMELDDPLTMMDESKGRGNKRKM